jgi:hypothetical protein
MVTSMGRRRTFSFVFATFWTVVALTLMSPARVNGGETNTGRLDKTGVSESVTRSQQPVGTSPLTPEEMRAAKPMPLPGYSGPPIPEQRTPRPFTGPPGSSPGNPGSDPIPRE